MKIEDLENYTRVIAYDDDNHGVRIFVNGIYIDNMDNSLDAAVHILFPFLFSFYNNYTTLWT